jgi:uncharacterized membrane protein YukC
MNINLYDGYELLTINTNIIWWINSDKTFNELLSEALTNLETKGYKVVKEAESYDYLADNLPQFIKEGATI